MSLRLASVAWRRDSTSPKNQYRDGNVKTLGTKLATIVIWEGRWIILAPFILMWVSGPPGRVAFCESGGSYNRAVVIKSTYLWTLLSSDHTGLKASYWPKSVGSCLSLADVSPSEPLHCTMWLHPLKAHRPSTVYKRCMLTLTAWLCLIIIANLPHTSQLAQLC